MSNSQEDPNSGRRMIDTQMRTSLAELTVDVRCLRDKVEPLPEALRTLTAVQERMAAAIEATHRVEIENREMTARVSKMEEEVNRNCALCDRLWNVAQWALLAVITAFGTGLWWFFQEHLKRGMQ